ncbi:DUF6600 domain-containing protein [Niabella drilacis]|uniref:YXWGXW repeat-containing protein n=1 Tax=Niabella drilacis (strain DSM 25811 / CCM 8410 / CCUG 62505 / LMG 26954 / E90) TaxID=1285928 RepID=A0A1G6KRJ3_NIADE|nr:DUF6600 domain-containing protein [Niabella drilacis]SDC33573.1 hypothetical protein SAMN04487894_10274 [Niabella drilacis]
MKTKKIQAFIRLLLLGILFSSCATAYRTQAQVASPAGPITYQTFYDDLAPYGTWINYPGYGQVWHPSLAADFRPYATGGHWVYSDEGWAWASDYGWGWAPFHYGRWLYDDLYGWLWIPGYDWSPAWVTWGYTGNYYCWAPLMPGIAVNVAFNTWRPHSVYWNVVERGHIYDRNLTGAIQRPAVVSNIHNNITIINNFNTTRAHNNYYSRGPEVADVQKYTSTQISRVSIREIAKNNRSADNSRSTGYNSGTAHSTPGKGNRGSRNSNIPQKGALNVYRPVVQQPQTGRQPQPREFKQVERNNTRPVQSVNDGMIGQRQEQMTNVNRLPRQAGMPAGRGGRRARR